MAIDRDGKKEEVRDRTSILEITKRYVDLKRAGTGSWKGLCPFHQERSPSFHVNETHQYFHCFGCGEKGDVFTFLMKIEGRAFREVLEDLARSAGVELDTRPMTPAERKARAAAESERERMFRVAELAAAFFQEQFAGPAGAKARAYIEGRGLGARTIERFRVGYAPAAGGALQARLRAENIPIEVAEQLGLIATNERGRYDFFRDRVMLPVFDRQRRVVGFSSRLLDPEAKAAKYVNSPDSPLFHKKEQLYGLPLAQDAIRRTGVAVVVEGNFDVMSLHEAGVENVVAPMGTALTVDQVGILTRAAPRVVVVFDGDDAGQRAADKSVPLFVDAGADGRVARMPAGIDPDDFVRKEGAEAWGRVVENARPALDHLIDRLPARSDLTTIPGRVRALEETAPLLARVKNAAERELYGGRLAAALSMAPSQVLRALRSAASKEAGSRRPAEPASEAPAPAATDAAGNALAAVPARNPPKEELEVLALLHAHPTLASDEAVLEAGLLFTDTGMRTLLESALRELRHGAGRLDVPAWLDAGPPEIRDAVAASLADDRYGKVDAPARVLADLRSRLLGRRLDAEIEAARHARGEALQRGDADAARSFSLREMELIRNKQGASSPAVRPNA